MRLAHVHLPKLIPYTRSLQIQEAILNKHFAYNNQVSKLSQALIASQSSVAIPSPTLLTFQTYPVYTVGRRHLKSNPLSEEQVNFLTTNDQTLKNDTSQSIRKVAAFHPSPRGGLLTYHAPGQLTAYLIINLRTHGITPRCFIRLLENTVIRTCARHGVPNALITDDPGVWIGEKGSRIQNDAPQSGMSCGGHRDLIATTRKICAVGVHVNRGMTSHGIGLNVTDYSTDATRTAVDLDLLSSSSDETTQAVSGYLSWGFGRIVACGLEGKTVTWLTNEGAEVGTTPDEVASTLAEEVCQSLTNQGKLQLTGIDRVDVNAVL